MSARFKFAAAGWTGAGVALLVVMLALPLFLFAALSYWKLGFVSWSYYVPYEEFGQNLASGDLRKIYYAPLIAVNVTSGFLIANMFTYTLGHTLVTLLLVGLVVIYVARVVKHARSSSGRRLSAASAATAAAAVFVATAASSSAALTGCHGAGSGGGIVALAGFGSIAGAWAADAATCLQAALGLVLAGAVLRSSRKRDSVLHHTNDRRPWRRKTGLTPH